MGYYTDYKIEVKGKVDIEEAAKKLESISNYSFDYYKDNMAKIGELKWYDWEPDMIELSKAYPTNLFQVDGEGEESGDVWRCFFKDGRKESVQVELKYGVSNLEQEFEAAEAIHDILTET